MIVVDNCCEIVKNNFSGKLSGLCVQEKEIIIRAHARARLIAIYCASHYLEATFNLPLRPGDDVPRLQAVRKRDQFRRRG